jgi:nicotinate phosphoribosyltransferase
MSRPRHPTERSAFGLAAADLALATDLYQLTMAAAYHAEAVAAGEMPRATFELWVRRLPPGRNFLVFAGLEQALAALAGLRFRPAHLAYLRALPPFAEVGEGFWEALAAFRFRGDVRAMAEGTVFFAEEPVLSVRGSLLEAQIVETLLLSIVNFQSMIAAKAARVRLAAGDRARVAEFGARRAHGPHAAAWAARAAYVGGVDSSSAVLAGFAAGVPVVGTMAHSFIMAFEEEADAFRRYQEVFPEHSILLVDTYDTLEGVRKALAAGGPFQGVRLDSGDIASLARETRRLLDEGGRPDVTIFASGDMDEHAIAALLAEGAPIDAFGVGTRLSTSADAPYLNGIYKLVEVERGGERVPTFKTSAGKATYPGPKQVVRSLAGTGDAARFAGDRVVREGDEGRFPAADRLLAPVMRGGEPLGPAEPLAAARRRCLDQLRRLPPALRSLAPAPEPYPVTVDPGLEELLARQREAVLG